MQGEPDPIRVTTLGDNVSRRELLLLAATTALGVALANAEASALPPPLASSQVSAYVAKDFSHLLEKPLTGFSSAQIGHHLQLYKRYVAKTNKTRERLHTATPASAGTANLRALVMAESYAHNAVMYHELYFGQLGRNGEPSGILLKALEDRWGSLANYWRFARAYAETVNGWVLLGLNTRTGRLDLFGLDMHNMWTPAGIEPILGIDVYEHAFGHDHGTNKTGYIETFANNINWQAVENRLKLAFEHPAIKHMS